MQHATPPAKAAGGFDSVRGVGWCRCAQPRTGRPSGRGGGCPGVLAGYEYAVQRGKDAHLKDFSPWRNSHV
ncbi:MAG: hypothetical protein UZ13_01359 [Chloroflexi bacterium OLB13]|nr:MAG: hypothetical protein UZ13_01359 [Chloroflexi bacterium OLB13]